MHSKIYRVTESSWANYGDKILPIDNYPRDMCVGLWVKINLTTIEMQKYMLLVVTPSSFAETTSGVHGAQVFRGKRFKKRYLRRQPGKTKPVISQTITRFKTGGTD